MTEEAKFPHDTVYRSFCRVSHWKGNTYCDDPQEWDRCTVTPTGIYAWGEQTFTREEASKIQPFLAFLDKVYEAGWAAAKAEIRQALGVK